MKKSHYLSYFLFIIKRVFSFIVWIHYSPSINVLLFILSKFIYEYDHKLLFLLFLLPKSISSRSSKAYGSLSFYMWSCGGASCHLQWTQDRHLSYQYTHHYQRQIGTQAASQLLLLVLHKSYIRFQEVIILHTNVCWTVSESNPQMLLFHQPRQSVTMAGPIGWN